MSKALDIYAAFVKTLSLGLAAAAGLGVISMMGVTCVDVAMGLFGRALTGALDIVKILGGLSVACALPYTTAVKGHVAIEYFFLKLPRRGRIRVDSLMRLVSITLFGFLAWESAVYGASLHKSHTVSMTLQIPLFWVAWVIAFCCAATMLVVILHLVAPGREAIKP